MTERAAAKRLLLSIEARGIRFDVTSDDGLVVEGGKVPRDEMRALLELRDPVLSILRARVQARGEFAACRCDWDWSGRRLYRGH